MSDYKVLDYIKFPIVKNHCDDTNTCFVVYSTKEAHIYNVIDVIENVFSVQNSYKVILLGECVKPGESQYSKLMSLIATSLFAVVILDGFRPNVLFELGIIIGLNKPCIVLIENDARIDVANYINDPRSTLTNPRIDIDKHFSDIKDRFYVTYEKDNLKGLRQILEDQYRKIKEDIERNAVSSLFPGYEVVEEELRECVVSVVEMSMKAAKDINKIKLAVAIERIEHFANKYKISISKKYYLTLASIFKKLDDLDEALKFVDKSLNIDPESYLSLLWKAFIYMDLRDEPSAISAINDAIKIKPDKELLWHSKGNIYDLFDKKDEALICYEKAMSIDNHCSTLRYNYASVLYEKKRLEDALVNITQAIELEPQNYLYHLLQSKIYEKLKLIPQSIESVKNSLSFNSDSADGWYQLGNVSQSKDDRLAYYNKAINIDPTHYPAHCNKGTLLANTGQADEALKSYQAVIDLCEKGKNCTTLLLNFGTTKYFKFKNDGPCEHNNFEQIEKCFKTAAENADDDEKARCHNNLGYLQLVSGSYKNAIDSLNKSLMFEADENQLTKYNLSAALVMNEELDLARSLLKELEFSLQQNNCYAGCGVVIRKQEGLGFVLDEKVGDINLLIETRELLRLLESEETN